MADEHRGAHFACAAALALPDGTERVVEGQLRGTLRHAPAGWAVHWIDRRVSSADSSASTRCARRCTPAWPRTAWSDRWPTSCTRRSRRSRTSASRSPTRCRSPCWCTPARGSSCTIPRPSSPVFCA
ncbi:hypothetical protein ACFPZH_28805, partial [Mycobacterium bouchedurhonense]